MPDAHTSIVVYSNRTDRESKNTAILCLRSSHAIDLHLCNDAQLPFIHSTVAVRIKSAVCVAVYTHNFVDQCKQSAGTNL